MTQIPRKSKIQLQELARMVSSGRDLIAESEKRYNDRLFAAAETIIEKGAKIVLLTGPSASGKTTTANKLALALRSLGTAATVISMDNFFKNKADYPRLPDGRIDFESVETLDIPEFQRALDALVEKGSYMMPRFDFSTGNRAPDRWLLSAEKGSVFIAEGIHALNPMVSDHLPQNLIFRAYASLREEYYEGDERRINTRNLRIVRRCIRDMNFRSYSIENTLNIWDNIMQGEEKYIKPYKDLADMIIDTSFMSEVPLFAPRLRDLISDEAQGGAHRDTLLAIAEPYLSMPPLPEEDLPKDSVLREFLGGLEL